MLQSLSGRVHHVYTGVVILQAASSAAPQGISSSCLIHIVIHVHSRDATSMIELVGIYTRSELSSPRGEASCGANRTRVSRGTHSLAVLVPFSYAAATMDPAPIVALTSVARFEPLSGNRSHFRASDS